MRWNSEGFYHDFRTKVRIAKVRRTKVRMQMFVRKYTQAIKFVCQKYVRKCSYAKVRMQKYVVYKVRMSKVRTQMFVRKSTYAKVRSV